MKKIFLIATLVVFISNPTKSQLLKDAANKLINAGDIVFTPEFNTIEKKKEVMETKTFTLESAMYGTIYLNKKIGNHSSFYESGGKLMGTISIKNAEGKSIRYEQLFTNEDKDKKFTCFEIIPSQPSLSNRNHTNLAQFFSEMSPKVQQLLITVGDNTDISGKVEVDLTNGIGKFKALQEEQARLDKLEAEKEAKQAAEEEKKRKEEEAKRNAALKIFQNAKDIVKIAVRNKCQNPGNIYVETGNEYTNDQFTINGGQESEYFICRPGNKIYLGDELIYTVSSASANKTIDFCPPKTEEQKKEEDFEKRMLGISFDVKNSCSEVVYYLIEEGASTTSSFMNGNTSTSVSYKNKGTKVWLSNEQRDKLSLLFEATSYSQHGTTVILCQ